MTTPGDSEQSIEAARQLTALEGAVKAILDEAREGKLSAGAITERHEAGT